MNTTITPLEASLPTSRDGRIARRRARRGRRALYGLLAACSFSACVTTPVSMAVCSDIEAKMHAAKVAIDECYAAESKRDRTLKGQMIVAVEFEAHEITPADVEIEKSDLNAPAMNACVVEQMARLRLEAPPESAITAVFPMEFAQPKVKMLMLPLQRPSPRKPDDRSRARSTTQI